MCTRCKKYKPRNKKNPNRYAAEPLLRVRVMNYALAFPGTFGFGISNTEARDALGIAQNDLSDIEKLIDADNVYARLYDNQVYARLVASASIPILVHAVEAHFDIALANDTERLEIISNARYALLNANVARITYPGDSFAYSVFAVCRAVFGGFNGRKNILKDDPAELLLTYFDDVFEEPKRVQNDWNQDLAGWFEFPPIKLAGYVTGTDNPTLEHMYDLADHFFEVTAALRSNAAKVAIDDLNLKHRADASLALGDTLPIACLKEGRTVDEALDSLRKVQRTRGALSIYGANGLQETTRDQLACHSTTLDSDVVDRTIVGETAQLQEFFQTLKTDQGANACALRARQQRAQVVANTPSNESLPRAIDRYQKAFQALLFNNAWENTECNQLGAQVRATEALRSVVATIQEEPVDSPLHKDVQTIVSPAPIDWRSCLAANSATIGAGVASEILTASAIRSALTHDIIQQWRGSYHAMLITYLAAVNACCATMSVVRSLQIQRKAPEFEKMAEVLAQSIRTAHQAACVKTIRVMMEPTPQKPRRPQDGDNMFAHNHVHTAMNNNNVPMLRYLGPITDFDVTVMHAYWLQMHRDTLALDKRIPGMINPIMENELSAMELFLKYAVATAPPQSLIDQFAADREHGTKLLTYLLDMGFYSLTVARDPAKPADFDRAKRAWRSSELGQQLRFFVRRQYLHILARQEHNPIYAARVVQNLAIDDELYATVLCDAHALMIDSLGLGNYKANPPFDLLILTQHLLANNIGRADRRDAVTQAQIANVAEILRMSPQQIYYCFAHSVQGNEQQITRYWLDAELEFGTSCLRSGAVWRIAPGIPLGIWGTNGAAISMSDTERGRYWQEFAALFTAGFMAGHGFLEFALANNPNDPDNIETKLWGECVAPIESALCSVVAQTRAQHWNQAVCKADASAREIVRMYSPPSVPTSPRQPAPYIHATPPSAYGRMAIFRALVPINDCSVPQSPDAKYVSRIFMCQWFLNSRPVLQPVMMRVVSYATYLSAELCIESDSFSRRLKSPRTTVSERIQANNTLAAVTVAARIVPMRFLSTQEHRGSELLLSPRARADAVLLPDDTLPPFWLYRTMPKAPGATFRVSA